MIEDGAVFKITSYKFPTKDELLAYDKMRKQNKSQAKDDKTTAPPNATMSSNTNSANAPTQKPKANNRVQGTWRQKKK